MKVGLLAPLSGGLEFAGGDQRRAAELAVDHVNAGGGVLGRELELVVRDTESRPRVAREEKLPELLDAGVESFVHDAWGNVTAWAETVAEEEVLHVYGEALTGSLADEGEAGGHRYVAATGRDERQDGLALGLALDAVTDARTATVLYPEAARYSVEGVDRAFDGEVVATVGYDASRDEYDDVVATAVGNDPDAVVATAYSESAAVSLFESVRERGTDVPWVTSTESPKAVRTVLRDAGMEAYDVAPAPTETDGTERFHDSFGRTDLGGPGQAYDAVMLLALAMQRAGTPAADAVSENLRAVSRAPGTDVTVGEFGRARTALAEGDVDYRGASGEVDLGPALAPLVPFEVRQLAPEMPTATVLDPGEFQSLLE